MSYVRDRLRYWHITYNPLVFRFCDPSINNCIIRDPAKCTLLTYKPIVYLILCRAYFSQSIRVVMFWIIHFISSTIVGKLKSWVFFKNITRDFKYNKIIYKTRGGIPYTSRYLTPSTTNMACGLIRISIETPSPTTNPRYHLKFYFGHFDKCRNTLISQ